jgi:hypothetical protein
MFQAFFVVLSFTNDVYGKRNWKFKTCTVCWLFVRECCRFFRLISEIVGFRIRLVGLLGLFYGFPGYFTGFWIILRDSGFVTGFRAILQDSGLSYGIPDYFTGWLDWCGLDCTTFKKNVENWLRSSGIRKIRSSIVPMQNFRSIGGHLDTAVGLQKSLNKLVSRSLGSL